jgi:phosphatidylserine/phosphatidylglycerophosphate/cardiolipin synthase-like enzyme
MYTTRNLRQFALLFALLLTAGAGTLVAGLSGPGSLDGAAAAATQLGPSALTVCGEPICAYFTDPALPYGAGPDSVLAAAIDSARLSLDVAAYELELWSLRDALLRAHRRGLPVRLVLEADTAGSPAVAELIEAGIPVQADRPDGLMHDKFVVIDHRQVWTGSTNFTLNGAYRNDNNLLALESEALAGLYTAEFEEMFVDRLFGAYSPKGEAERVEVGGVPVEVFFAPEAGAAEHIVALIESARMRVYFMAFSFTSDQIGAALLAQARAGLDVRGVFDESQVRANRGSEYPGLLAAGLDVRLDGGRDKLHHKVILIDGRIIITGSYNFSASAATRNDENLLVIEDPALAGRFEEEFWRVYAQGK